MERFAKIVNNKKPLTTFAKHSTLDVWQFGVLNVPGKLLHKINKLNQILLDVNYKNAFPTGTYVLKVNKKNTRPRCKIYSKLASFIVNFESISYLVLVFLLLTLNI